jgi:DICT domain-containing protein
MEPQDNKQLALRKAVAAHEQAEAAMADLMKDGADPLYQQILESLQRSIATLRQQAETSTPAERV